LLSYFSFRMTSQHSKAKDHFKQEEAKWQSMYREWMATMERKLSQIAGGSGDGGSSAGGIGGGGGGGGGGGSMMAPKLAGHRGW
jgi:uncharacterized membrane protein